MGCVVSWGTWATQTAQIEFLVASWRGKEPLEHWVEGNSMQLLHGEWRWAGELGQEEARAGLSLQENWLLDIKELLLRSHKGKKQPIPLVLPTTNSREAI